MSNPAYVNSLKTSGFVTDLSPSLVVPYAVGAGNLLLVGIINDSFGHGGVDTVTDDGGNTWLPYHSGNTFPYPDFYFVITSAPTTQITLHFANGVDPTPWNHELLVIVGEYANFGSPSLDFLAVNNSNVVQVSHGGGATLVGFLEFYDGVLPVDFSGASSGNVRQTTGYVSRTDPVFPTPPGRTERLALVDSLAGAGLLSVGLTSSAAFTNANALRGPAVPLTGNIIVDKVTVPTGDGNVYTFRPSWEPSFQLMDGENHDSGPLAPGVYSVAEDPTAGLLTSISVSNGDDSSSINLTAGTTISVTFTNSVTTPSPTGGDHFVPKAPLVAGPVQVVPLNNKPNQVWEVTVQVNGIPVTLSVVLRYNEVAKYWVATIRDLEGNMILDSVPFVTGDGVSQNILGQFAYLGIGSASVFNASVVNA